jgi:hypothetical protein
MFFITLYLLAGNARRLLGPSFPDKIPVDPFRLWADERAAVI